MASTAIKTKPEFRRDYERDERNSEENPIECEYVFPISDDSVVTSLEVKLDDGRILTAKIEEETKANEDYQDTLASGHTAYMAKKTAPDRMVLSIGNLAPGCGATVLVTISFPLTCSEGQWKFYLPASLTTLFNEDQNSSESSGIRPENCSYTTDFSLRIQSQDPVENVVCKSHEILVEQSSNDTIVTLNPDTPCLPDRDFVITYSTLADNDFFITYTYNPGGDNAINYTTTSAGKPSYLVNRDPETGNYATMVSFLPKFLEQGEDEDDLEGSGEFIFVLDRSASMRGSRIQLAKEAAILFIKSLPMNTTFNIISFGNQFEAMFPQPVAYSDENTNIALSQLSTFDADMGGTNIYEPLKHVFQQETKLPRQIFLLTDGQVRDREQVVNLIGQNIRSSRVHAFGIGNGVDNQLIKLSAKAGKGVAEFIEEGQNIQSKVIKTLRQAVLPALSDWKITWPFAGVSQAPSSDLMPVVYYNEVFSIYAVLGTAPVSGDVVLDYLNTKTNQREQAVVNVSMENVEDSAQMHKFWAKERIRELELAKRKGKDTSAEIIQLSRTYNIPSSLTAYLCIEKKQDPVEGEMELRRVPIVITSDRETTSRNYGNPGISTWQHKMPVGAGSWGSAPKSRKCKPDYRSGYGGPQVADRSGYRGAQIADYRSGCNTVLSTKAGAWEKGSKPRIADYRSGCGSVLSTGAGAWEKKSKARIPPQAKARTAAAPATSMTAEQKQAAILALKAELGIQERYAKPMVQEENVRASLASNAANEKMESFERMGQEANRALESITTSYTSLQEVGSSIEDLCFNAKSSYRSMPQKAKEAKPAAQSTGTLDMEVIKLQSANGSWGPNALSLIGFTTESPLENQTVWATAVIVKWLKEKYAEKEDSWFMVVRKADKWLKSTGEDYASFEIHFK